MSQVWSIQVGKSNTFGKSKIKLSLAKKSRLDACGSTLVVNMMKMKRRRLSGARCMESDQASFIKLPKIEMRSREEEAKMKVFVEALSGKTKCDEEQAKR